MTCLQFVWGALLGETLSLTFPWFPFRFLFLFCDGSFTQPSFLRAQKRFNSSHTHTHTHIHIIKRLIMSVGLSVRSLFFEKNRLGTGEDDAQNSGGLLMLGLRRRGAGRGGKGQGRKIRGEQSGENDPGKDDQWKMGQGRTIGERRARGERGEHVVQQA
jgi:hypothetical protein